MTSDIIDTFVDEINNTLERVGPFQPRQAYGPIPVENGTDDVSIELKPLPRDANTFLVTAHINVQGLPTALRSALNRYDWVCRENGEERSRSSLALMNVPGLETVCTSFSLFQPHGSDYTYAVERKEY